MSKIPYRIPDDKFINAVREAYEDGAIDDVEGGVPSPEIADRLDINERNARHRLNALVEDDVLVRVLGVNPDTMRRRQGYLCPDHAAKIAEPLR